MLDNALILLPDFLIILFGCLLKRRFGYGGDFWLQLEKLVYYVLFPVMLFRSVVGSSLDLREAGDMVLVGFAFTLTGVGLGMAGRWLSRDDSRSFASSVQCAFRFNTYIGLAVIDRVAGPAGVATFALLVGFIIPLANAAAVWFLARHSGGSLWRELLRNPLILATLGGLLCKGIGIELPAALERIGNLFSVTAITMGLLCVGAGLRLGALRARLALVNYLTVVKLLVLPAVAIGCAALLEVGGTYRQAAVILAALPTASSAYILATRMGGDGQLVASIITLHVFAAMLTMPLWLSLA